MPALKPATIGQNLLTDCGQNRPLTTMMTKKDAVVYGVDHIRVNSIHPGTIVTPLTEGIAAKNPDYMEKEIEATVLGYLGEPEDIAYAAVYLGSDESKFMTGAQMVIDGGYTAK